MLTKVLAVVFAVAVPAVGGFVYIHSGGTCPFSCSDKPTCATPVVSEETPACCATPSRASCCEGGSCCGDDESAATPEVLAIQPREVK